MRRPCLADFLSNWNHVVIAGKLPPHKVFFANINFSSISAQWREKLESAINSAELVKAVKLPPDKAPTS